MADRDELALLEAERDQLLSMIAHHERSKFRMDFQAPTWFVGVAIGIVFGIGVLIVAGIFAGQIAASFVVLPIVFLVVAAYILSRKISVFGTSMRVGDILGFLTSIPVGDMGFLSPAATIQKPGEPQIRQRLADCDGRITELKERRP
jgi:hypothetical protein